MTPPVPAGAAAAEADNAVDVAPFSAAAPVFGDLHLERIGFDSYCITSQDRAVGFVEVVGRVFVVYQGSRIDRAVEVAQVLDLPAAVRRIADAL